MKIRVLPQGDNVAPKFQVIAENTADEVFLKQLTGQYGDADLLLSEVVFNDDGVASLVVTSDGLNLLPSNFCQAVRACLESSTPEAPFIQPMYNVFQGDTNYQLGDTYNLSFTGAEDDGDVFYRLFDPFGNDIGGIEGTNSIGADSIFNNIRGAGIILGEDNRFNTIIGQNITLGDNVSASLIAGRNISIGDSENGIFIFGEDHVLASGTNYSGAWGVGHDLQCDNSYIFGTYGECPQGGIAVGNGTDALNRSNAHDLRIDGRYTNSGAVGNTSAVEFTAGGNWQIPDNVSLAVYNPAVLQAAATINLPINPIEGHVLDLLVGGTITSGAVVTALTLSGGLNAIIGSILTTLNAGLVRLRFTNGKWYIN
jgi:hypothetical protein